MRLVLATFLLVFGFWSAPALAARPDWVVTRAVGPVFVQQGVHTRRASSGSVLKAGAVVRTGEAARAVLVRGREYIVLSPASQLRLPLLPSKSLIQIIQEKGAALFKIEHKADPHFAVGTPYLAAVVKGTTFRVVVGKARASVRVQFGAVRVAAKGAADSKMVTTGFEAAAAASFPRRLALERSGSLDSVAALDAELLARVEADHMRASQAELSGLERFFSSYKMSKFYAVSLLLFGSLVMLFGAAVSYRMFASAFRARASSGGTLALEGPPARTPILFVVDRLLRLRSDRLDGEPVTSKRSSRVKNQGIVSAQAEPRNDVQVSAPDVVQPVKTAKPVEVELEADAADPNCRRQDKRSRVLLSAVIHTAEGESNVLLFDVSRTGAVAESQSPPAVGAAIELITTKASIEAEVVWVRSSRFGMRFKNEIDDSSVLVDIHRKPSGRANGAL